MNRIWGDLGMGTGLTLKPAAMFSQPELYGEYRQRPIRLYTYKAGTQGNRITYTAVDLTVNNPTNSRLEITPSGGVGNFFGKILNAQDVEIGTPAFDARFVIKSNPPDFAMKVLGDAWVQMEILDIPDVFRIELEGSSLKYSKTTLRKTLISWQSCQHLITGRSARGELETPFQVSCPADRAARSRRRKPQ